MASASHAGMRVPQEYIVMFWEFPNPQNQHGTSFQTGVEGHFLLKFSGLYIGLQ